MKSKTYKSYEDKIYIIDRVWNNDISDYEFYESIKKKIEDENGVILEVNELSSNMIVVKWRKYKRKEEAYSYKRRFPSLPSLPTLDAYHLKYPEKEVLHKPLIGYSTRYPTPRAYHLSEPEKEEWQYPESKFDLVDAKLDAIELVTKYIDERINKPLKVGEFEWGIDNETISKFKIRLNLARGKDVYPYGVFDFNKKVFHFTIQRMKNLVDRLEFEYTKLNDLKDKTIKKINKCDRIKHINKIIEELIK